MANAGMYRAPVPPKMSDPFDGIIAVDKPAGPTSHDIVAAIRRKFKIKKVGHGGTLDPQATGVLVILTGKGTKLSSRFMSSDKVYEGTIRLGSSTDTQDAEGNVLLEGDFSAVTLEQMEDVHRSLRDQLSKAPSAYFEPFDPFREMIDSCTVLHYQEHGTQIRIWASKHSTVPDN